MSLRHFLRRYCLSSPYLPSPLLTVSFPLLLLTLPHPPYPLHPIPVSIVAVHSRCVWLERSILTLLCVWIVSGAWRGEESGVSVRLAAFLPGGCVLYCAWVEGGGCFCTFHTIP